MCGQRHSDDNKADRSARRDTTFRLPPVVEHTGGGSASCRNSEPGFGPVSVEAAANPHSPATAGCHPGPGCKAEGVSCRHGGCGANVATITRNSSCCLLRQLPDRPHPGQVPHGLIPCYGPCGNAENDHGSTEDPESKSRPLSPAGGAAASMHPSREQRTRRQLHRHSEVGGRERKLQGADRNSAEPAHLGGPAEPDSPFGGGTAPARFVDALLVPVPELADCALPRWPANAERGLRVAAPDAASLFSPDPNLRQVILVVEVERPEVREVVGRVIDECGLEARRSDSDSIRRVDRERVHGGSG